MTTLDTADYGLPPINVEGSGAGGIAEIGIGGHVGAGGYAVVREGRQFAVGRHVAVKTLHNYDDDPEAVDALVREARVLAHLDHPNIVPVHMLGQDTDGAPLVVMPLIKGVSWTELIDRYDHPFWDQHTGEPRSAANRLDRLSAHLGILMKVANACQHAHERGIIHCDIKPDNVMVGEMGQVFLIDWGLALRTLPIAPADLPYGDEVSSPAGSPNYMAPEMAACEPLTVQSDVYLLGGCLHEVLTGFVPHPGNSTVEALAGIRETSNFAYDAMLPAQLTAAASGALCFEPRERFGSARAFREAVVHHLDTRLGQAWLNRAHQSLTSLGEAVDAGAHTQSLESVGAAGAWDVHEYYAETRYSLQQAAEHGADASLLQQSLDECIELMSVFCLDRGDVGRAEQLIRELGGADARPALAQRLAGLMVRKGKKSSLSLTALKAAKRPRRRVNPALVGASVTIVLSAVIGVAAPALGFAGLSLAAASGLLVLLGLARLSVPAAPFAAHAYWRKAGWQAVPYLAVLAVGSPPVTLVNDALALVTLGAVFFGHAAIAAASGGGRRPVVLAVGAAVMTGLAFATSGPVALRSLPMLAVTLFGTAVWVPVFPTRAA